MRYCLILISLGYLASNCSQKSSDQITDSENDGISDTIIIAVDSTSRQDTGTIESEAIQVTEIEAQSTSQNPALIQLFKDPLDLRSFKIKKRSANSGSRVRRSYFPKQDTIGYFYNYFWFHEYRRRSAIRNPHDAVIINTYIFGEEIGTYEDVEERLVSIKGMVRDPDLERLDLVGRSIIELDSLFGSPQFTTDKHYLYHMNNDLLILGLEEKKVAWFNFLRTNLSLETLENVPSELLYYNERMPVTN